MQKTDLDILKEAVLDSLADKFDVSTLELYNRFKTRCNESKVKPEDYQIFMELLRNFKIRNTVLTINENNIVEIRKFIDARQLESSQKITEDIYCPIYRSLKKIECAHCSGLLEEKQAEIRKHKVALDERHQHSIRKEALQKETEALAVNHDKDWTDEELLFVIVNTHNHDKNELEVLYQIAIHLKRTLAAIEWAFIRIWEEENRKLFEDSMPILERIDSLKEKLGV